MRIKTYRNFCCTHYESVIFPQNTYVHVVCLYSLLSSRNLMSTHMSNDGAFHGVWIDLNIEEKPPPLSVYSTPTSST